MSDPLHADPDARIDRARLLFDIYLRGYESGEITFEALARVGKRIAERLPEGWRRKALGSLIWRALDASPKPRERGQHGSTRPSAMRDLIVELVSAVSEGEGSARTSPETYSRVIDLCDAAGIKLTVDQIRDSCRPR